ncbi:DUF3413 domain-containing protein [Paraglaciecola sp. L3A3]|uniref:DUF3413 domain-containing protein n=1 Tax=Paraglaciecola sp. L3A3 TaxID=2686358 RepID=UPI00131C4ACD|nr:DUF3413 domain-containing protein [Paraglaciecola sp. L3A3]
MILTETPRRKLVTQLVNWGHWFTLLNIIIAITIAGIYILNSPMPETTLGVVYLLVNWVSHVGFLTFFAFVILILPLCYLAKNAKTVKIVSSILAALGLASLGFDALLYNKYGVHLSINSADIIRHEAQTVIAQFSWQQWGYLLFLFLAWLSFQLVVANALWARIDRLQKRRWGFPISGFFVSCFVASHALHVWADANLYQPIVQQDNIFPLSYPATAKTLMARYSLLDIEDYQQRKALQFNHTLKGISYPSSPVYCPVNKSSKVLLLAIAEGKVPQQIPGLVKGQNHYGFHSSAISGINSILYGLPELYHQSLQEYQPILLNLPRSMGLDVSLYLPNNKQEPLNPFIADWAQFKQKITNANSNLSVGFIEAKQLSELLTDSVLAEYQIIITNLASADNLKQLLFTNIPLNKVLSSQEDLAPTALTLLGCNAQTRTYSTGNSLTTNSGVNYVVGTQGSKVLLLNNNQRIEIMNNGSVKIFDLDNSQELFTPINTDLLSQGIKNLTHFSAKRSYKNQ